MITVPQAVDKIVGRSRYLSEALAKDLINTTSLARYIKVEVEEMVYKKVTISSIAVAIKRMDLSGSAGYSTAKIFEEAPDMIIRSNLSLFHLKNSKQILQKLSQLEKKSTKLQKKALFSYGRAETVILTNKINLKSIKSIMSEETISNSYEDVSSVTIHLPSQSVSTPGVIYFLLKSIAWEGINILEIISTESELTLVVPAKNINSAFAVLTSLFRNK